jgi:hypothetical protein
VGISDVNNGNSEITGGGITLPFKIKKKPFEGITKMIIKNL